MFPLSGLRLLVARYARSLHATEGESHHVASPLGAWLLLALCAPAADRRTRAKLAKILGVDVATAAALAARLLERPHPLVLAAAGVWLRLAPGQPQPASLLAGLSPSVTVDALTSQQQLDAWANQATRGLIDRFPIPITPDTALVLATALATKVTWRVPFGLADAAELGANSVWAGQVRQVLRAVGASETYLCPTREAGDVAVHSAEAVDGLIVLSVMARPGVPAGRVLAAAHELAFAAAVAAPVARHSLFDLPLGDTALWSITEEYCQTTAPGGREESYYTVLPAWSAQSDLDLGDPSLGFSLVAPGLAKAAGLPRGGYQARQAAVAHYTRTGFEAAAVSAIGMVLGCPQTRPGVIRRATVRFGHPFAVVAAAVAPPAFTTTPPAFAVAPAADSAEAWHGLPVFSAWVTEIEEASDR